MTHETYTPKFIAADVVDGYLALKFVGDSYESVVAAFNMIIETIRTNDAMTADQFIHACITQAKGDGESDKFMKVMIRMMEECVNTLGAFHIICPDGLAEGKMEMGKGWHQVETFLEDLKKTPEVIKPNGK